MTLLAVALSLVIVAVGAVGVVAPDRLHDFLRSLQNAQGMAGIAIYRITYGLALYMVGPAAESPEAIRGLGIFVIVAGLITPFIGVARFQALTEGLYARGSAWVRVGCVVAVGFGLAVVSQLSSPL